MKWACMECGHATEIPNASAWPDGCFNCGSHRWISDTEVHAHTDAEIRGLAPPVLPPAHLPNVYVSKGGLGGGGVTIR